MGIFSNKINIECLVNSCILLKYQLNYKFKQYNIFKIFYFFTYNNTI